LSVEIAGVEALFIGVFLSSRHPLGMRGRPRMERRIRIPMILR